MAKAVNFGLIYKEYLNGFHFHCTNIKATKGEKLSALVHLLSISVITDITTYQILGTYPETLEQMITIINVNNAVFMDYLITHGGVDKVLHAQAIAEFKEAYTAVAHRIHILFGTNLPSVQTFLGNMDPAEEPEAEAQTEEIPESSKIILAK